MPNPIRWPSFNTVYTTWTVKRIACKNHQRSSREYYYIIHTQSHTCNTKILDLDYNCLAATRTLVLITQVVRTLGVSVQGYPLTGDLSDIFIQCSCTHTQACQDVSNWQTTVARTCHSLSKVWLLSTADKPSKYQDSARHSKTLFLLCCTINVFPKLGVYCRGMVGVL